MWKDKYIIGVEKIDEQHKELFCRVSGFLFLLRRNGNCEDTARKAQETLEFMQSYIVTHFEDEESYQKEINYLGLRMHKEIHEQIKYEVCIFAERFNDEGYSKDLVQKFASKLLAWMINHVGVCDREIAYFAKENST
jgi:hemerythrin